MKEKEGCSNNLKLKMFPFSDNPCRKCEKAQEILKRMGEEGVTGEIFFERGEGKFIEIDDPNSDDPIRKNEAYCTSAVSTGPGNKDKKNVRNEGSCLYGYIYSYADTMRWESQKGK
jgi:hypothetical protein